MFKIDKDYLYLISLIFISIGVGLVLSNIELIFNIFNPKYQIKDLMYNYLHLIQNNKIYAKIKIYYEVSSNLLTLTNKTTISNEFICEQYLSKKVKEVYCKDRYYSFTDLKNKISKVCLFLNNSWRCFKNENINNEFQLIIKSLDNILKYTNFQKKEFKNKICFFGYVTNKTYLNNLVSQYLKPIKEKTKKYGKYFDIEVNNITLFRNICFTKKAGKYIPKTIEEYTTIEVKLNFKFPTLGRNYSMPLTLNVKARSEFLEFKINPEKNPITSPIKE